MQLTPKQTILRIFVICLLCVSEKKNKRKVKRGYNQAKAECVLILSKLFSIEKALLGKVGAEVALFLLDT